MLLSDNERETLRAAADLLAAKWSESRTRPLLIPHKDKPETVAEVSENRQAICDYLKFRYGPEQREHFAMLLMDFHGRMIDLVEVAKGTGDNVQVPMREAMKAALAADAANVVLIHNHPGGDSRPSDADLAMTKDWVAYFRQVDIDVRDHIVVSSGGTISIRATLRHKANAQRDADDCANEWASHE